MTGRPVVKITLMPAGGVAGRLIGSWPPGCGEDGCLSHPPVFDERCVCPQWFDGRGAHLASLSAFCSAHPLPAR